MVFSQTSHKTQSILKVVDLDRLKPNKKKQVNGNRGVIAGGLTDWMPSTPAPAPSFSEDYLKVEPSYNSTMFHDSDCEFFQDLVQWCSDPVKGEPVQTIDSKKTIEERANDHNNTIHNTPISPHGWEAFDTNSPLAGGMYSMPREPVSPVGQQHHTMLAPDIGQSSNLQYQEEFLDFNNMPVVFEDLGSTKPAGTVPGWEYTHNDNLNTHYTTYNMMPFEAESVASVIPRELEGNDVIISDVIYGGDRVGVPGDRRAGLTVTIPARAAGWPADLISTPDIVSCVEQMEKDTTNVLPTVSAIWPAEEVDDFIKSDIITDIKSSPQVEYEPITPKSESHGESDNDDKGYKSRKRRYNSEDSDETYTPYEEPPRRKYTRRKSNIPIKDMIKALEGSQPLKKAKRGRPPKRRESTVSSLCSADDTTSNVSPLENKYRELRDKNNEASKRSRMNRKIKELHVEQLAIELEEKNKKLQIKADILEDMTKRLRDAFLKVISQKK